MTNGFALAAGLGSAESVPRDLVAWETRQRPVTNATQWYSRLYGRMGTRWPRRLADVRSGLIWSAGRSKTWQARVNVAAHEGAELVNRASGRS